MSNEKSDLQPLVLPERSQIAMTDRGFEIINDGDIVVRAKVAVGSLRSLNGDIHLLPPPGEKQVISSVEAPNGMIKIIGDEFEIMEIRAKEIFCDMRLLSSKVIRADEEITLNRGKLQTNAISGRSIHFSGSEFTAQHAGAQEVIEFQADNVYSQVITGNQVQFQVRGAVRAGKITAHGKADIDAKSVDIDYLSAQSVRITPQTQGVIVCLDGAAPSEPNSIVGMLSPATLIEKIPSLTGLMRELQAGQSEKLIAAPAPAPAPEPVHSAELSEKEVEKLREKPPELYRTSAEIPLPYREMVEKSLNAEKASGEEQPAPADKKEPEKKETPVFEPAAATFSTEIGPAEAALNSMSNSLPGFNATQLDADHSPLDLPHLDAEPVVDPSEPLNLTVDNNPATTAENSPLSLTSDGAIDLGFDVKADHE
jgi:hypothetical protein